MSQAVLGAGFACPVKCPKLVLTAINSEQEETAKQLFILLSININGGYYD